MFCRMCIMEIKDGYKICPVMSGPVVLTDEFGAPYGDTIFIPCQKGDCMAYDGVYGCTMMPRGKHV